MNIVVSNIPAGLRTVPHWVVWRLELKNGRETKVPYSARTGRRASSTDPTTWSSFEEAAAGIARSRMTGVGFVLTLEDDFVGIDLDHCVDPATGEIAADARAIVAELNSYTETSPSGTGIRVFTRARLPEHGRKRGAVEMYEQARFLTVTGHHVSGTPTVVEARHDEVLALHARIFEPPLVPSPPAPSRDAPAHQTSLLLDDEALVRRAMAARNGAKFVRLWSGDAAGYSSGSEADLALCSLLAFWTGPDAFRLDRLFRSSGLMRSKWDERHAADGRTYGEITIGTALMNLNEWYDGPSEDLSSFRSFTSYGDRWPHPLAPEAFHGLVGEFVHTVEPATEADLAALLGQFLVAAGNAMGRGSHLRAEADRHGTNTFIVIVAPTAKGRKGTSWGRVRQVLELADPNWAATHVLSGMSSGEGLIWAVRDPVFKTEPIKEHGVVVDYQEVMIDAGVTDKRLLAFEGEFASTLRVLTRDGNTLSAIIRNAWDMGSLRTLTKNSPAHASEAHISIVAHITQSELLRYLDNTEAGNGYGNRHLWFCARRSKVLPGGATLHEEALAYLGERLGEALRFAADVGQLRFDEESRAVWHAVYGELSEGKPGLLGAMIARGEAQVLRLACIYAVLDLSAVIRREHLEAALAVWDYAEASARYLFGDALGDPVADELLRALRASAEGLTRTEIRDLFGRNRRAAEIDRSLTELLGHRLAARSVEATGGRPVERWRAVRQSAAAEQTTERQYDRNDENDQSVPADALPSFSSFRS